MLYAKEEQIKEVFDTFRLYKDIFPHLRYDFVQRKIKAGECVFDNGVAITYTKYKRNGHLSDVQIYKDEIMIHQIANATPGKGNALDVLTRFLNEAGTTVYLSVRSNNFRAIKFYEKLGFKKAGEITWKHGEILGTIFRKQYNGLFK